MKILNVYVFNGMFADKEGNLRPYTTVCCWAQYKEGQFPRAIHFNANILDEKTSPESLVGKRVDVLYSHNYGKQTIAAIKVMKDLSDK